MSDKETDLQIVEETLAGNTAAFDILVRKYYQQMYSLSYRITGSSSDAEDVTQQAFMKAFTALRSFKKKSAFSTWLYRITCNVAINIYKKRKGVHVGVEIDIMDSGPDGLDQVKSSEEVKLVQEAINSLPKKQRLAIIMRTYENLSFKEIASILKCSDGAVKANYFHGIQKMKDRLSPYYFGEDDAS